MKKVFAVTAALALLGLSIAAQAVTIATVPVGNAGNAGELSGSGAGGYGPDRICGSVSYAYNIGRYEVTAGQYTEFLNAKANVSDTYALYNTEMSNTSYGSGITRSGASGSYTYSVASVFVNRPVNYVGYWDSCRFANWLGNGQGAGSTETGAYTMGGYNGYDGRTIQRNAGAKWAVTSEDEWYKAAYYKGDGAGYWDYPTSSDTAPGQDMADASGNNANYCTAPYAYPIDSGKYTTVAGEFQNSDSPYGTFDQGGNVWEWNEAIVYQDTDYAYRGLRGGSFGYGEYSGTLLASYRNDYYIFSPTVAISAVGFRVSEVVPEPSSIIALAGGLISLLGIRRRRV
ncbi:MAG: SUMF1/EgtB/PvdO family nonheme iron enzyme [Armatimonadetes bacterium]|nr:SUMF1/EgtB/PvdO family nonheme iron enzyme [Armatimonadota bacterium]